MLLRVQDGYCVSELEITDDHRFARKALRESRPADEGIIVLGIKSPQSKYIGAPGPDNRLYPSDVASIHTKEAKLKP